jgi:hypothetical protein
MNQYEKYLWDLRGYLVVKNALTSDEVASMNDLVDEHVVGRKESGTNNPRQTADNKVGSFAGSDRTRFTEQDDRAWSSASLLSWGGPFIDLIDHPSISPYLEEVLQPGYRIDHDYLKIDNKVADRLLYLHGGGQGAGGPTDLVGPTDGGQCYYRYNNGKFYSGLIAVAYELRDVHEGDGGFACVPGSHKANIELPQNWKKSVTQGEIPECVDRVSANAGDAIIFTEACAHGTVPWQGDRERRTLFYKYTPHAVAWSPCYYNADHYGDLTERQRNMLMPPSAYGANTTRDEIWKRAQAEQTELIRLREEVASLRASA